MKLRIKLPGLAVMAAFLVLSCARCQKMNNSDAATARKVVERGFSNPLAIPAFVDGSNAAFDAKSGTAQLGTDVSVNALGYGGAAILGPTIRIRQGEGFNLAFSNNLSEATNIHWHGLEVPAAQDGYPTDVTAPGGSFQYNFPVKNRPGTYWYHPHPDMATASQAWRGLAGFFVVTSPEEESLGLPSGEYDVPLVVQDKRLDGGLTYNPDTDDRSIGMFGESILVNGTASPVLEVATRTYRFRLLNGSNARIYNFAFSSGAMFHLIGSDGGLLDAPVSVSSVMLAPGERADILFDFDGQAIGSELYLQSNAFAGTATQGQQAFYLLKFRVTRQESDNTLVPDALMPVEKIPESQAVATRSFNIGHMMQHGGMDGMVMHPIDGKTFDPDRRDEVVKAGTVEIWEFDNSAGTETHPMHLHAGQFQVLSRTGGRGTIEPWEKGWKDTVLAFPGEKVRIIVRFPDLKGKFVFHCHNLEHEDGGMMLNYEIQ
ncbi:MAG: multicopper oxidase domain-containing protein [Saprospiraceae bacterium]|nr:multicopper oxidase domain-containing protein [Saprospiraceae bacterium]